MTTHLTGIDHAIIGVRDLDQAKSAFETLGFRVTPRGKQIGRGTANHCLMFDQDHVELLGVVDSKKPIGQLDDLLQSGGGLLSLALGSTDIEATRNAWKAASLGPDKVKELGHQLESIGELRFKNVMLDRKATAGVPMFAISALNGEALRRPDWIDHPNGVVGISTITAVVDNPASFADAMGKIFGDRMLTETDDTLAVHTGHGVLLFATPDDLDMLHPQFKVTEWAHVEPKLAVLSFKVKDLGRAAGWLDHVGVPYHRDASGTIGIDAEHGQGVLLEFTH